MTNESKFRCLVAGFFGLSFGIGIYIGDPVYLIRMAQSGSHEGILLLLSIVIGLTMRERCDDDSISALLCAIAMAVFGMMLNGLVDLEKGEVEFIGVALCALFFSALWGTIVFLIRALKGRVKTETKQNVKQPAFIRTPSPRYRR